MPRQSSRQRDNQAIRSLRIPEWPTADRQAWEETCRPGSRFRQGGAASYLAEVSRADIARRYGPFLDQVERRGLLVRSAAPAGHTTPDLVASYIAELQGRVRSVTVWNCIYKLRRASELLAPEKDFSWLTEVEKDLAFVMEPRSKYDRLVLSERLLEAGLTLVAEAELSDCTAFERARRVRNGTMLALLTLCPIRVKNFAALQIGTTLREIEGVWWIILPSRSTKSQTPLERRIPALIKPVLDKYILDYRPVLLRPDSPIDALWVSSTTRKQMTTKNLALLVANLTEQTIGVAVSPHLFRTAAASTAAVYAGHIPYLGSAVLDHRDRRVTEERYNRAPTMTAAQAYASLIDALRSG
jgi:integrase